MSTDRTEATDSGPADAPDPGELAEIVELLRLEHLEVNMFRGRAVSAEPRRLYGGQVAAQALAAAGYTVEGARPHSLHAYFLRPGDTSAPVVFGVEPLQDGRTFKRRRVTAIQGGEAILCLESSFTADGTGTTDYPAPPKVPAPEDCPAYSHDGFLAARRVSPWRLFETRPAVTELPPGGVRATTADMWFRLRAVAESEGILGEAIITYMSDLTLSVTALRPSPRRPRGRPEVTGLTSLDHSVWFHNPADLSDWLLYAKIAPAAGPVRSLTAGQIFDRRGVLIASVAQECLTHSPRPLLTWHQRRVHMVLAICTALSYGRGAAGPRVCGHAVAGPRGMRSRGRGAGVTRTTSAAWRPTRAASRRWPPCRDRTPGAARRRQGS